MNLQISAINFRRQLTLIVISKKCRDSFLLIYHNYYHLEKGRIEVEGKKNQNSILFSEYFPTAITHPSGFTVEIT